MEGSNSPPLSVVMITLNEAAAITKVVTDIKRVVPEAEVVVVDSSSDDTANLAEKLGCRVIRQLPPKGYGPAMDMALQAAKAPIIVTVDCDDTYPAEAILFLLDKMDEGFDIVSASRLKQKPDAMPWGNYLANCLFNWLALVLTGVRSTDLHTGMRAYKRSLFEKFHYQAKGMALPVELLVGPALMGYKYAEIFVDYRPRIGESTLRPIEGTIWTIKRLWRMRTLFRRTPYDFTSEQE
jgi:glycosyltransferase involved in cell wall biosynthesis